MRIILFFVLLVFLAGCTSKYLEIETSQNEKVKIRIEVADTGDKRSRGLMFRENICKNCGMLFIFDDLDYISFWMKNTLIPLDIVFIDENFTIVDIQYAIPCEEDPCRTYDSRGKAKYVLEVNEGFTEENNIKLGDKIEIR
ncbi:DUF192 domain-containing protein [Candidatus Woesearchaeota archaeon]|nr:DUF192 domain-containing protein [Candidatus Woesearchaeota archaeon]